MRQKKPLIVKKDLKKVWEFLWAFLTENITRYDKRDKMGNVGNGEWFEY